jgi:hypothetical protein
LKIEAKNSLLNNQKQGKILFRNLFLILEVEKTDKNSSSNKSQQFYLMDIDSQSPNFDYKNTNSYENKNNS